MNIAILSGVDLDFGGGGQRPAHLYRAYNKLGHHKCNYYNGFKIKTWDIDFNKFDLIILEYPFKQASEQLKHYNGKIIYEILDDWAELGSLAYDKKVEKKVIALADLTTAVSKKLAKDYKCIYSPNAVDLDLYDSLDVPAIKPNDPTNLIVGYVGHLRGWWFDWEIIKRLSEQKNIEVHIVGEYDVYRFTAPNVFYHGKKSYEKIPGYVKSFDVGIIPFKKGKLFDKVSPLKAYEYIAANVPIVSMYSLEQIKLPDLHYADDIDYFVDLVNSYKNIKEGWVIKDIEEKNKKKRDFIEMNTWKHRATFLLEALE